MHKKIKIFLVSGARPNFMKIAPVHKEIKKYPDKFQSLIIHTGQHYDYNMSKSFFVDLELPEPDYFLEVGPGSHAGQTAKIMVKFEKVLLTEEPDIVIIVGDVNSTLACALVASKIRYPNLINNKHIPFVIQRLRPLIVHVESGLRSFDCTMPEEINRIITDAISDILLSPSPDADDNLKKEGISIDKIVRVGNIMVDTLKFMRPKSNNSKILRYLELTKKGYGLITLHRPSNVDNKETLREIVECLLEISKKIKLVFSIHPRTKKQLELFRFYHLLSNEYNIKLLNPLSYPDFMNLLSNSKFVLTDSGGLQEETTYLGIPCLTLRPNTERPITVLEGTNELIEIVDLDSSITKIICGKWKKGTIPEMWEGKTAQRVINELVKYTEV